MQPGEMHAHRGKWLHQGGRDRSQWPFCQFLSGLSEAPVSSLFPSECWPPTTTPLALAAVTRTLAGPVCITTGSRCTSRRRLSTPGPPMDAGPKVPQDGRSPCPDGVTCGSRE